MSNESSSLARAVAAGETDETKQAKEEGQRMSNIHPESYMQGKGVDQTDRSVDEVAQMQQRVGAVPMDPAALAPGDK